MGRQRILCVVAVVAALVAATPVMAQRLSLAERVTKLENQANVDAQGAGNANLEAQNRLVQLQSEISSLRNTVETLQNQLEQLKEQSRQQAIDADGRLTALEGGAPTASAAPTPPRRDHATVGEPAEAAAAEPANAGFTDVDPPPADSPYAEPTDPADAPADLPADPAAEEATYQAALDTLVERFEAADSARMFQAFIRDYPDSPLLPNAYYWLGESYYVTQNYELAVEAFSTLLRNYRDSRKEPDALLKLGYCQIALNDRDRGELTLRELVSRHPGTDAAAKAESRLRTLAIENR